MILEIIGRTLPEALCQQRVHWFQEQCFGSFGHLIDPFRFYTLKDVRSEALREIYLRDQEGTCVYIDICIYIHKYIHTHIYIYIDIRIYG